MSSSSAAQLRKIKKPLIEKKRRERMNECLNQLKILVLEGKNTNTNEPRYSKMEKVDILEMTVGYLRDLRRVSLPPSGPSRPVSSRYIEGYNECAVQVGSYLENAGELSEDARRQLRVHLLTGSPLTRTPGDIRVSPGDIQVSPPPPPPPPPLPPRPSLPPPPPTLIAFSESKQPLFRSSPAVLPSVPKPVVLPLAWGGEGDGGGGGGRNSTAAALSGTAARRDLGRLPLPAATATPQVYRLTSPATIATGLSAHAHRMIVPRSFPLPVLTSPALLVVAGAAAAAGSPYGLLCGSVSPRQGDECPTSAAFSPETTDARGSTNAAAAAAAAADPKAEPSTLPSSPPNNPLNESTVDGRREGRMLPGSDQREGQTPPGCVWRPWNGQTR